MSIPKLPKDIKKQKDPKERKKDERPKGLRFTGCTDDCRNTMCDRCYRCLVHQGHAFGCADGGI